MSNVETGKQIYTARALRQDAATAMKGDILNALMELITNADDAYKEKGSHGQILIEIDDAENPFKLSISVRDQALGLPADLLKSCFIEHGTENRSYLKNKSAEEGSRGLFGRGAKDIQEFGKAVFKSIYKGKFSEVQLDPTDGSYSMPARDMPAQSQQREELGLPDSLSGLSATVYVLKNKASLIPSTSKIAQKLSTHVSLREIIQRNRVILVDRRTNSSTIISYKAPKSQEVMNIECSLPSYERKVKIVLRQFEERQQGNVDEYSYHGLVIRDKRANYENTFLSLSSRPEAGWFCGEIFAPEIDILNRQIDEIDSNPMAVDERVVQLNPTRLVRRSRDGLERSHSYFRALEKVFVEKVKPFFDAIAKEEDANRVENRDLRKKLDLVSKTLTEVLQEALNEADAGDLPEGGEGTDFNKIGIIPPRKFFEKGEIGTLTIRIPELAFSPSNVNLELVDKGAGFEFVKNSLQLDWKHHERLPLMTARTRILAKEFGTTELLLKYGDEQSTSTLICLKSDPDELPEVTQLVFSEPSYFIAPTRTRNLLLMAPAEFAGETVKLSISEALLKIPISVQLYLHPSGKFALSKVKVTAERSLGVIELKAVLGDEQAVTQLVIRESDQNKGPKISIVTKNQDSANRSSLFLAADILKIEIYAKHRAVKSIIGPYLEDKYKFDDSPAWHAVLSEIVSTHLVNYALEREFARYPNRFRDAASLFVKQQGLLTKFLTTMQSVLVDQSNSS